MNNIKVVGIDLAKSVFQLHGTDGAGKCVFKKRLKRAELAACIAQLPRCLIGLEACGSAHHWARLFQELGHEVKLMAPQFVKPYVRSNKNDQNDARAIAEAVTRPEMRFVAIKTREQQDILLRHRARELAIKHRIAQGNQIRGLLAEYGVILPQGKDHLKHLPSLLEDNALLSKEAQRIFKRLYEAYQGYEREVEEHEADIQRHAQEDVRCQELQKVSGVGPLIASAAVATIGDAKVFKRGRELSAYLGLVPKQHSSGNKIRLGGITKRGDVYLRKLLVHGSRSVLKYCENKTDKKSVWARDKKHRLGFNKAAVALANKQARIIWGVLVSGQYHAESPPVSASEV